MQSSRIAPLAMACLLLWACKGRPGQPSGSGEEQAALPGEVRYRVRPDPDLSRLDVEVCFAGAVPARLAPRTAALGRALIEAQASTGAALEADERGVSLAGVPPGACARLALDLGPLLDRGSGWRSARRLGRDVLLSPEDWLWRPAGQDGHRLVVAFELPEGMAVSVPWRRAGELYEVPATPRGWRSQGALGYFAPVTVEVPGGRLRVAVLGDGWRHDADALLAHLGSAARAVSQLYDGFPVAEAQILIAPTSGRAVRFGLAAYGGGPSITLWVGTEATAESLRADWVAVHEMLHLGMPLLDDASRWLSEGMATYYEPLLRARAGLMPPNRAWEELHDGFGRGASRGSGRALRDETEHMNETRQYWRVYWAGAAIALLSDVALREQGRSLDDVMRHLRDLGREQVREWSAEELIAAAEARSSSAVLSAVAARHVAASDFPDVSGAYRVLGLSFDASGALTAGGDERARRLREAMETATPASR